MLVGDIFRNCGWCRNPNCCVQYGGHKFNTRKGLPAKIQFSNWVDQFCLPHRSYNEVVTFQVSQTFEDVNFFSRGLNVSRFRHASHVPVATRSALWFLSRSVQMFVKQIFRLAARQSVQRARTFRALRLRCYIFFSNYHFYGFLVAFFPLLLYSFPNMPEGNQQGFSEVKALQ